MVREAFPDEGLIELAGKRPTLSKSELPGPAPGVRTHVSGSVLLLGLSLYSCAARNLYPGF